jgi:hypothetical protein
VTRQEERDRLVEIQVRLQRMNEEWALIRALAIGLDCQPELSGQIPEAGTTRWWDVLPVIYHWQGTVKKALSKQDSTS